MADFSTVAISVATALGIQSAYYAAVDYPYQLHKDKAKLAALRLRENIHHATTSRTISDIGIASEVFGKWSTNISELLAACKREAVPFYNFRNELEPELYIRLSSLQAIIGLDGANGYHSIILDLTEVYQSALRINKQLTDVGKLSPELINELDSLLLFPLRMNARIEQVQLWEVARQGEIRLEMANVEADINHTTRRLHLTSHFFSIVLFIVCLHFCALAFTYLQFGRRVQLTLFAALTLIVGYSEVRFVAYFVNSANRQADVSLLRKLDDEVESFKAGRL